MGFAIRKVATRNSSKANEVLGNISSTKLIARTKYKEGIKSSRKYQFAIGKIKVKYKRTHTRPTQ